MPQDAATILPRARRVNRAALEATEPRSAASYGDRRLGSSLRQVERAAEVVAERIARLG
jgi:hypothetical protein